MDAGLWEDAYRQHSQQRGLASVLQADHRDIHLGRPVHRRQTVSTVYLWADYEIQEGGCFFTGVMIAQHAAAFVQQTATHQNNLNNQSYTFLNMFAMMVRSETLAARGR
jgi:hypothetical protein